MTKACLLCGGILPERLPLVITATDAAGTLAERVEEDVADVLGSIPPLCSICGEELSWQHDECIERALACLRMA